MKAAIEGTNQEIELIEAEDLEEMKLKLYSIEGKVCKGTASNEDVKFVIDIVKNTGDYSDLLKIPGQKDYEFQAKTDYQALGSSLEALEKIITDKDVKTRIKDTLSHAKDISQLSNIHIRIHRKSLNIQVLAVQRKPFKKDLDLFFDLLNKNTKSTEAYAKKWVQ